MALARIFVSNPDILLLDEPFSALDGFLRNKLQMEMKKIMESFSNQTVLVTHDRDEAYMLSKETVLVDSGKVVEFGSTKSLFDNPKTLETALLTGCKNFSQVRKISDKEIELVDYGFSIRM